MFHRCPSADCSARLECVCRALTGWVSSRLALRLFGRKKVKQIRVNSGGLPESLDRRREPWDSS